MAIRALDLIARVSSRFVDEILPVATASVIGAMLVNHYGRQPPLPVPSREWLGFEGGVISSL
jgi:hypothetical protein